MDNTTETKSSDREVKFRGFSKKKLLKNIAANLGISQNDWGKMQLYAAIDAAPEHLKKDPTPEA